MSITEETRREGHEAIDKAKRQAMILGCLHGRKMTARQIAYELGFSDLNAVKPRLTELRKAGRVKAVGKQKDPLTRAFPWRCMRWWKGAGKRLHKAAPFACELAVVQRAENPPALDSPFAECEL